ncbi:MAG TPA: universal stress protein [Gemmataceae bacterium]|nr:universal stress protein [Gemmataceae bacterium]
MLLIRTIVHPTDLPEQSSNAFELASALARDYDARLVLLHIAAPTEVVGEAVVVTAPADNQEELRDKVLGATEPHTDHRVEHRFTQGDAATEILRAAQEERADLIMMSSHGRTGLGQLGSAAEQVVRKAPCHVLTVEFPPLDTRAFDEKLWTFTRFWFLERIRNHVQS